MVIRNIGFALRLARQLNAGCPNYSVDLSDLEGAALLGLCDAASRYDEKKGFNFRTYCYFRVRGAMYDMLRRETSPLRKYAKSRERLSQRALRADEEPSSRRAAQTSASIGADQKLLQNKIEKLSWIGDDGDLTRPFAKSRTDLAVLSEIIEEIGVQCHSDKDHQVSQVSYLTSRNPEQNSALLQMRRYLVRLIAELPTAERQIIQLRYFEDRSFEEIRIALRSASKSLVSRLHTRALDTLKEKLLAANDDVSGYVL